jgi:hypothetical protein
MEDVKINGLNTTIKKLRQNLKEPETQPLIYQLFEITHPELCPDENAQAILINEPYNITYPTYDTHDTNDQLKTRTYNLGVLIPNPRRRTHDGEDMIGITQEDLDSIDNQDLPDPAFTATVEGRTLLFYTYSGATFNEPVSRMAADNRLKVDNFILFSPLNMVNCVSDAIEETQNSLSAVDELHKLIENTNEEAFDAMGLLEQLQTKIPSTL